MTDFNEDSLHILIGRATYVYTILPVPTIRYYQTHIHEHIEAVKQRGDCDVKIGERNNGYLELKVMMNDKKEYTTDWDVLLERIDDKMKLEDENKYIKQTIKEAYENERTQLGRSVLKQLLEKIE